MRVLALILLGTVQRLARWLTYRDCTCPGRPWLDADHEPGCPHPLLRRPAARRTR